MTYKLIIQVGEKKVIVEVESDEILQSKDIYVDKVLRKKEQVKQKIKQDSDFFTHLKNTIFRV